ncbi:hypothetical protein BT96DRAFT_1011611 [Gymnopus androsaceus JB14]|uniref:Uncharacterized protein n=1 Tax=Gymnopus androsaceus JB14 TaxID=1447944 RepID=A0A6A4ISP8_9AGAR|nr:hypothetical protein BT96DRAFT_1011611 [Gymnopus androsaceus JB14]
MTEPTEETALLQDVSNVDVPFLKAFLSRLCSLLPEEMDQIPDIIQPSQLSGHRALLASFSMLVLLLFREKNLGEKHSKAGPWDAWKHETLSDEWVRTIDRNIEQIWTSFLDAFCDTKAIENVLWTEFRLDEKSKPLRVVDFVSKHPKLLNDRVVELSMTSQWKRGASQDLSRSRQYLTSRYDALCTPWIYHAFDLATRLTFLLLLVSYVLNPPHPAFYSQPLEYIGVREILLVVLAISALLDSSLKSMAPFALTLFAFLFKLPSAPFPQDFTFNLLLLSLVVLIFQLHLPSPPSPLFLFWPERSLPLAVLILEGVIGTILRLLLFFLPVLILSVYFLSYALSDVFLRTLLPMETSLPAPMPTREAFFILSACSFIIFLLSVLLLVPFSITSTPGRSPWDQYSTSTGQMARIEFYRAVIRYSKPYPFPPPFNILYSIFIAIPLFVLTLFHISTSFLITLQRILWRVFVGPFAAVARLLTFGLP